MFAASLHSLCPSHLKIATMLKDKEMMLLLQLTYECVQPQAHWPEGRLQSQQKNRFNDG